MDSLPLYTIVVPALIAGILWGIDWRIWRREPSDTRWLHALAIPVAFVVAFVALWGWPGFEPRLAEGWLCHVAILGAVLGMLQPVSKLVSSGLAYGLISSASVIVSRTAPFRAALAPFLGVMGFESIEFISERRPGASIPFALWLWTSGCSVALASTGSIKYGQLAGILAATLGAATVMAWIKPNFSLSRGAVISLVPLMTAILLCGAMYSELPVASAVLLGVAPLALWFGELNVIKNRPPWLGVILRAFAVAIPVAIALLIACWPMLFPDANLKGQSEF